MMKEIQLILVVETNASTRSDDAYYSWLMKNFFQEYVSSVDCKNLRILYKFVYMDGKTNFDSSEVQHDIMIYRKEFVFGESVVVYCFDVDTKTKKDNKFIKKVTNYCLKNDYYLSLAHPEIEASLNIPASIGSKHDRAVYFSKHYPKKTAFNSKNFFVPMGTIPSTAGSTSFCAVIQEIINHYSC